MTEYDDNKSLPPRVETNAHLKMLVNSKDSGP